MDASIWLIGLVLVLVLTAEFINGWTDAPNAIATVVATSTLSVRGAVTLAVICNILGALSGTAVVAWSSFAASVGIPTSESHALIAGLAGAGLATATHQILSEAARAVTTFVLRGE